jgi:hypothetical protein
LGGLHVKTLFVVVMSTFALGTSAFAATVTPIEGTVQVNAGSGFHSVSGAAEVAPGTSVMVSPKGRGEIRYSDGCKTPVLPGSVAVVSPVSPCAQGQAYPDDRRYLDTGAYLGLGLAAAGFGAAAWAATQNNGVSNPVFVPARPASP